MNYIFPVINHINDVLPAIEGRKEFIVAERGHFKVINYNVVFDDTFPEVFTYEDAIRRECRGLIFDKEGRVLSRRFHKFFNVNERPETSITDIDFSKPHIVLEKLDGSMITPLKIGTKIFWGTKMGLTEVASGAEDFVKNSKVKYEEFAEYCHQQEMTPIFEWVSRKQRIVVDYIDENLILTAIRNNSTGKYASYNALVEITNSFDIPVVKSFDIDTKELVNYIRSLEGSEGVVVRFCDGHMIKIKSEWYTAIHKAKDYITQEKNIIDLVINNQIDDLIPLLLKEDADKLTNFSNKMWENIFYMSEKITQTYNDLISSNIDRKEYALNHSKLYKSTKHFDRIIFSLYDNKKALDVIVDIIKKNTGTGISIDSIRSLIGNISWNNF